MSILDHYWPARLRWTNSKGGFASRNGTSMALTRRPFLGFDYAEIDYAPGACELVRRTSGDRLEDMLPHEIEACQRYLAALDITDPPDPCGGGSLTV